MTIDKWLNVLIGMFAVSDSVGERMGKLIASEHNEEANERMLRARIDGFGHLEVVCVSYLRLE